MHLTNQKILQIAMEQSAIDLTCKAEDFLTPGNKVVHSKTNDRARKYLQLPFSCNLVSYGGPIVASVCPEVADAVGKYIDRYPVERCFETPNLHVLDDALAEHGLRICFMAEYFLPDMELLQELPCPYTVKLLERADLECLYQPAWSNALCERRKHLDVLGVGAYAQGKLVGLAGCSADCEHMWQIGVDVLPGYRRQGIASAITSRLAVEIIERGKAPFYCAAWSNLKSVRNAIKTGFRPAWVELTAMDTEFVAQCNK